MKNIKCRNCFFYRNEWCKKIVDSPDPEEARDCNYFREMTNADRIRAMSDEEMAVFLYEWSPSEFCGHVCPRLRDDIPCKGECFEMRREWLQQPCDGGDNA